tara:strand:+ start:19618 stop:19824 length:207 start_codon:yes stop_codon:yes gene_type:complete
MINIALRIMIFGGVMAFFACLIKHIHSRIKDIPFDLRMYYEVPLMTMGCILFAVILTPLLMWFLGDRY